MKNFQAILFALFLTVFSYSVSAQLTIFNVPSTDILPKNRFYLEADFIGKFQKYEKGGFQTYGYRVVYGVRKNLEIGSNFYFTRNGSRPSAKEFQPNVKFRPYNSEKYGVAVTTGAIGFVPLDKSAGTRNYALLYTNVSKTISFTRGTRLTGGFYQMVGAGRSFGTQRGAIIGIEQPIKGRLSFLADWYSGNNRLGYSTAGLNYAFKKNQFVLVGYNFGNFGAGNNAFSAFYGVTF